MVLTLKFTASAIQRKLGLRTVIKIKEMTFELNETNVIMNNPFQINQGNLKNLKHMKTS